MKKNLIIGLCLLTILMVGCGKQSTVENITEKKEQSIEEIESKDQEVVQATGDNYHMEDTEEYQYGYQEGYQAAYDEFRAVVEKAEEEMNNLLNDPYYTDPYAITNIWDELGIALQKDFNNIISGSSSNNSSTSSDNGTLSRAEVIDLENKLERYFEVLGEDGETEPETEEELIDLVKNSKFGPCYYRIHAGITKVIPDVTYDMLEDDVMGHYLTVVAKGTDKNYENNYTIRFKIYLDELSTILVDGIICNGMTPGLEEQVEILEYLLP